MTSPAVILKNVHVGLTVFWALNLVGALILYFYFRNIWEQISILYLVIVSIYANFATHFGAYQGSRAEIKAESIDTETVTTDKLNVKKK